MKRETIFVVGILLAAVAIGLAIMDVARGQFCVPYATDEAFLLALVDATDGYTAETEKKHGDTTITYCNISDGNTASAYTDDSVLWTEVGDGTGEYKLIMGAGEFSDPGDRYLVKVVVSGCRTVRFWVDTRRIDPNLTATTSNGTSIGITSGNAHVHLKATDDNVEVDVNSADVTGFTLDELYTRLYDIVPADFNTVVLTGTAITADIQAVDGNTTDATTLATQIDSPIEESDILAQVTSGLEAQGNTAARMAYLDNVYAWTSYVMNAFMQDTPTEVNVVTSDSVFTIDAGPATDDWLNGMLCVVVDADDDSRAAEWVKDYDGGDLQVTLARDLAFTPDTNDVVMFWNFRQTGGR